MISLAFRLEYQVDKVYQGQHNFLLEFSFGLVHNRSCWYTSYHRLRGKVQERVSQEQVQELVSQEQVLELASLAKTAL